MLGWWWWWGWNPGVASDIRSLTDFKRDTSRHIRRLRRSGRPEILTVNGKATLVVQDAEAYQRLLDALDRAEALEGIRRGMACVARGEARDAREVLDEVRRKYAIPDDA